PRPTAPSYTTTADIGSHGSTYRVVVSNSPGVVTSAVATLTVDAVPSVTLQPANQAVVVSNDFAFHAQALGTQPLSYQWRTNSVNLLGATSPDVSLNARSYHAGRWDVIVTNRFGSVTSSPALLTVIAGLTQPRLAGNNLSFAFQSQVGNSYITQYKTNLNPGDWIPLVTNSGNGGTLTNTFPTTSGPSRFYRVLVQ